MEKYPLYWKKTIKFITHYAYFSNISQVFSFLSSFLQSKKTKFGSSLAPAVCLRYLGLFSHSGVQHILCCIFVLVFFFVLCILCCQFLWIVHFWLPRWYSLTFICLLYLNWHCSLLTCLINICAIWFTCSKRLQ